MVFIKIGNMFAIFLLKILFLHYNKSKQLLNTKYKKIVYKLFFLWIQTKNSRPNTKISTQMNSV